MRDKELKWLINLNQATLKFYYGKQTLESIVQTFFYPDKRMGRLGLGGHEYSREKLSHRSVLSIVQGSNRFD